MDIKRIMSGLLGIPLVVIVLIFANKIIIDIVFTIIALIAMHEYFNVISKVANPVKWVGYVSCFTIGIIHVITQKTLNTLVIFGIPTLLSILFIHVVITDMKISFRDIAYTFIGIIYMVFFISFLALIYGMKDGRILIWFAIIPAWGTDVFAYIAGKYFGKHKFSKVSPKKSIEGCIGGTIGAIIVMLIYAYSVNNYLGMSYSYLSIFATGIVLSLVGQIGDFAASTIKRFADVKDYGNIIPGHGGILDRFDSLIFLAPFAYALFTLL